MIISIKESRRKNKRFKVLMDDKREFHFGLDGGSTYIDHGDEKKRFHYRKRHLANETEQQLIENLIPSPSLLAYYLLWGPHTDLQKNIDYLNGLWKKKHSKA